MLKYLISFLFVLLFMSACSSTSKSLATAGPSSYLQIPIQGITPIGKTSQGQEIILSGFSGLSLVKHNEKTSEYELVTLTDRGPNSDFINKDQKNKCRPFLLPKFQPRIVHLVFNTKKPSAEVIAETKLWVERKRPLSGLPTKSNDESPCDIRGKKVNLDPQGADTEAVAIDSQGNYWIGEEYSPRIMKFSNQGLLLNTLKPKQGLPEVYAQRKHNGGFEGVAADKNKIFAILQTPFSKGQTQIRMVEVDANTNNTTAEYIYYLTANGSDRIGDLVALGNGKFLALEQNGETGSTAVKKIYHFDITQASNVMNLKTLDPNMSEQEFIAAQLQAVQKKEVIDLAALGINGFPKLEGLTVLKADLLALVNDNDFGLNGAVNPETGLAPLKDEKSYLFIVPLKKSLVDFQ